MGKQVREREREMEWLERLREVEIRREIDRDGSDNTERGIERMI